MKQQVNFYASMPHLGPVKLPLNLIVKIWLSLLFLAIALYGFESWVLSKQQVQLTYQKKQQQQVAQQMVNFSSQLPGDSKLPALLEALKGLQQDVEVKDLLVKQLQQGKLNTTGFVAYLVTLANSMPSVVWLQSIEIANGGTNIRLTGKSYAADAISELLRNLQTNPVFKNWRFQLQQVETETNDKGSTNTLNFVLEAEYGNSETAANTPVAAP